MNFASIKYLPILVLNGNANSSAEPTLKCLCKGGSATKPGPFHTVPQQSRLRMTKMHY
ncbi:hypothetical protein EST38_g1895 [Candolleomyces aberdarensis]|uniref:Uncharacterized protein n=1 Tax=Candolleomyces aberdarensis TaxID=2316362 RepID=A0A4Q2DXI3_9AGAR|nr:hypothetical protein EST38_g1895 [Candolleomyces aberdarensis]